MDKVRVGVIGCGAISGAYLGMAKNFPLVEMSACADLNPAAAKSKAEQFGIPKVCSVDELLKDPSIEIVLNLTVPKAHVPIGLQAVAAGKHMYAEKPLGIDREDARKLIDAARQKGVRIGCAPDTFMGACVQTARKLIEDGAIGKPVAFTSTWMSRGHEHWHPSPEFYYEVGGGPMLDMGPYYLTALLNLLGPIKRLAGLASISRAQRTIVHKKDGVPGPKFGKVINVETPDHVVGVIEFQNGCVGQIVTSFATRGANYDNKSPIVIYGTEGTLRVGDPNGFDGPVFLCRFDDNKPDEFVEMPHTFVKGYGRSVGVADMAYAIRSGRPHRANGDLAFAVLDAMVGFLDSSRNGQFHVPTARFEKPKLMPAELPFGQLDA
jgi:predicted dehydrogenase